MNRASIPFAESAAPRAADQAVLRLALPKGRMEAGVLRLLADAGLHVHAEPRGYRPRLSAADFETKQLKPQNIVGMLAAGSRDLGFAGADWVAEKDAALVELLDTGLDPVRLVVAAPATLLVDGQLPARGAARPWVVASEYERLARRWMHEHAPDAQFVRSHGATEAFPPEDADVVVDNTATGATLRANGLVVLAELMRSSTRLFASPLAIAEPRRRAAIDGFVLCLRAVLEARQRAMVELNVAAADLERVVAVLPCMREPTVAGLHGDAGYAVRAAVPRADLPRLVPLLKARGATDIVVAGCEQIVP